MIAEPQAAGGRIVGRYAIFDAIASGGMATVHLGRLLGPAGFSRTVAIKRLHPPYVNDPEFVTMLMDEARLAARVRHPNVLQTLDLVNEEGELLLVMEYVRGHTLSQLIRFASQQQRRIPHRIVAAIVSGALQGLHAAHEARDEQGNLIGLIHRDVSPQNVIVGLDGVARLLDFGVAKAAGRLQMTREGHIKGKLGYMAPDLARGQPVTHLADIYSMGIVLWEALTSQRLFLADNVGALFAQVMSQKVPPPSHAAPGLPLAYDEVVLRATAQQPEQRFPTALEMAHALEKCDGVESNAMVAAWLGRLLGDDIVEQEPLLESGSEIRQVREHELAQLALEEDDVWDALTGSDVVELPDAGNLEVGRNTLDVGVDDLLDIEDESLISVRPLGQRAPSKLLSVPDNELTRPDPSAREPQPETPAKREPIRAPGSSENSTAGVAPARRRSRWGQRFVALLLVVSASGVALYFFRDRLPPEVTQWVGSKWHTFLSFVAAPQTPPGTDPNPSATPALSESVLGANASASASASASAPPSSASSAKPAKRPPIEPKRKK